MAKELTKSDFGPAMAILTERQQKFVLAMVTIPGCTFKRAAVEAGYSDVADGAKVRGHYLAHQPAVQAAIREEAGRRLNSLSLLAANTMMAVMEDPEAPHRDKMKAASAVLDRTGFAMTQNVNVNKVVTDMSYEAITQRIRDACDRLGLDPEQFLRGGKSVKQVIDAQYSIAKPAPVPVGDQTDVAVLKDQG
jgi:phage terminase small subunit